MYVRQLTYTIDLDQSETFAVVQQHMASIYRRHGLIRFLLLAEPDSPEKITELQVYYDESAWRDAAGGVADDPLYPNLKDTLDAITGGSRQVDKAHIHMLVMDVGGTARG